MLPYKVILWICIPHEPSTITWCVKDDWGRFQPQKQAIDDFFDLWFYWSKNRIKDSP